MTIKEIAKICGVSRGTVDRVLNNRGKVKPKTEALILRTMEEQGYTKNMVGRALTVRKTAPVIGAIVSSRGNPFFDDVIRGLNKAAMELKDYGVQLELLQLNGYDVQAQLEAIDTLTPRISALVLHPINDPAIARRIDALATEGIATVTLNSDVEHCKRACYVGSDYYKGGQTIAAMMAICTRGKAQLGILTGVDSVLGHAQRLQGAEDTLAERAPGIRILARAAAQDDSALAYTRAGEMLAAHPAIDTLFVVAACVADVCRAVIDAGKERVVRVFAFDNVPSTVAMMERGLVEVVVCQQSFRQGSEAIRAAFDILLSGRPSQGRRIIMENQIRILQNIGEG